jgi:hypothetical protein
VEGSSEDVEGVTVKHRFLYNEGVKIHYVEAGNPEGKLVSDRSNAHVSKTSKICRTSHL